MTDWETTTTDVPDLLLCPTCSNGSSRIYHIDGPCPYGVAATMARDLARLLAEKVDREIMEVA